MRVFFYLEDEKSAMKVLPKWLKYLLPQYEHVNDVLDLCGNSFVMYSGYGYPQMAGSLLLSTLNRVRNAGTVDLFVVVIDSEGAEGRAQSMLCALSKTDINLDYTRILVVDICFETWLLGNKELMSKNFRSNHSGFFLHYDVSVLDPECMRKERHFRCSDAQYHFIYCNKLFSSKYETRFGYNKSSPPASVGSRDFLDKLIMRASLGDIRSFKRFLELAQGLSDAADCAF